MQKLARFAVIIINLLRVAAASAFSRSRGGGGGKNPAKVLILAYGAIGDFIFLLPALQELRKALPKARITCVGNSYPSTGEILPATAVFDERWTIEAPFGYRQAPANVLKRIRDGGFDAVLVSHPTSARFFGTALLSIPIRIGHCRPLRAPHEGWSWLRYRLWKIKRGLISEEFERRLLFNRKVWIDADEEHAVSKNLRLLAALGLKTPPAAQARARLSIPPQCEEKASRLLGSLDKRLICVHLGAPASQYAKLWPPKNWARVCRALAAAKPLAVALVGAPEERRAADEFTGEFGGPVVDLVGQCDLFTTFAVVAKSALFLSNDTGISKAAMALGVPTATVWGPSDRPASGAVWDPEKHVEIYRQLSCSPCVRMGLANEGSGVINFSNCGHRRCLAELEPAQVLEALKGRSQD